MLRKLSTSAIALTFVTVMAGCNKPAPPASPASTTTAPVASAPAPPATTPPPVVTPPPAAPTAADNVGTAKDTAANDPKGTLTKPEESKAMPMAGHGNNHSSPSLEPAPKK